MQPNTVLVFKLGLQGHLSCNAWCLEG